MILVLFKFIYMKIKKLQYGQSLRIPLQITVFLKLEKKNLKCQIAWFFQFKRLQYLYEQNGVYCRTCVFFNPNDGVGIENI